MANLPFLKKSILAGAAVPNSAVPARNGSNSLIINEGDEKSLRNSISETPDSEGVNASAGAAVPN